MPLTWGDQIHEGPRLARGKGHFERRGFPGAAERFHAGSQSAAAKDAIGESQPRERADDDRDVEQEGMP